MADVIPTVSEPSPLKFDGLVVVRLIDGLLNLARKGLGPRFFEQSVRWLAWLGQVALLAGAALGLLLSVIVAIKTDSFRVFLLGLAWVCAVLALQYTAAKFLPAGDQLLKATPTRLASRSFLDCYALLHLVGGLVVLTWFVVAAVKAEVLSFAWMGWRSSRCWSTWAAWP